jgi:IgA Peptidase M64
MLQRCRGLVLLLLFIVPVLRSSAQKFDLDTLHYNGKSANRINLVILGDGYTQAQLNKFSQDARKFKDHLFNEAPFSAYKRYFNVFAIKVPSAESGVKHPRTAPDCYGQEMANPDNYFGTSFDVGGIHRLVVPSQYGKIARVLADNFPEFDQVVLLANTPYYGGSGGLYATATLDRQSSEIAVHEMGHSFGGLADEYWAGENYAMEKANMTQVGIPELVKWKNWLTPETGIGIYPHVGTSWYKPAPGNCKMESISSNFCAVCSEAIIEHIHALLSPVSTVSPANHATLITTAHTPDFFVSLKNIKPSPNTLKTAWQLNGVRVASNKDSIQITPSRLQPGLNILSVSIQDTTTRIRSQDHLQNHRFSVNWTFDHSFALPVTLTSFKARAAETGVTLSWTTATEVDNDRFEVERSTNALDWHFIGMVPGHGTSHIPQQYVFYDLSPAWDHNPTIYYRLKQADIDGHFEYSPVEAVQRKPLAARLRLLGNPVADQLHFEVQGLPARPITLGIYSLDGSSVLEMPVAVDQQAREIRVPVSRLVPGVYIYSLLQDSEVLDTGRFLKINK